jgi:hypothetical protein
MPLLLAALGDALLPPLHHSTSRFLNFFYDTFFESLTLEEKQQKCKGGEM